MSLILRAAALCAVLAFAGACAHATPRLYDNLAEGKEPKTSKRLDPNPQDDWMHYFTRTAYLAPSARDLKNLGVDEQNVLKYWGKPNWVRKPFKSFWGEKVHEWVYLDGQQIFQFVDGNVVFEGPITDYEQTLIKRGFPNNALVDRKNNDDVMITMVYQDPLRANIEVFVFHNGVMTQSREGN